MNDTPFFNNSRSRLGYHGGNFGNPLGRSRRGVLVAPNGDLSGRYSNNSNYSGNSRTSRPLLDRFGSSPLDGVLNTAAGLISVAELYGRYNANRKQQKPSIDEAITQYGAAHGNTGGFNYSSRPASLVDSRKLIAISSALVGLDNQNQNVKNLNAFLIDPKINDGIQQNELHELATLSLAVLNDTAIADKEPLTKALKAIGIEPPQ